MNYRVLFIISFLILVLGVAGLFWEPSNQNNATQPQKVSTIAKIEKSHKVVITTAEALKDLKAGQILSADDYKIKEITVDVLDSATEPHELDRYSLKSLFSTDKKEEKVKRTLQGFLITENISQGSLMNPQSLIAPNNPKFLLSSLDAKKEVAFVVPIHFKDAFILKTLKSGDYISVYSKQSGQDRANANKNALVKTLDHILVLQINRPTKEEQENKNNTTAGNVVLKLSTEQAKELYSLPKEASIMLLPSEKEEKTDSKGNFIRNLRG